MSNSVAIDSSVTELQRNDPRFKLLHQQAEEFFNDPRSDQYKLLLGLHEAGGHGFFARKANATRIRFRGPTMFWDYRPPKYDLPAISRSATIWTPVPNCEPLAEMKAHIAGYIVRRELSGSPNDAVAIESDLDGSRNWYENNVRGDEVTFNAAVAEAEREILVDLRSPKIRREIWDEARKFVSEIFPTISNEIEGSQIFKTITHRASDRRCSTRTEMCSTKEQSRIWKIQFLKQTEFSRNRLEKQVLISSLNSRRILR